MGMDLNLVNDRHSHFTLLFMWFKYEMPFGGFGIFMDGDIFRPLTKQCVILDIGCGTLDLAIDTSYHWALPSCEVLYIYAGKC